VNGSSLDPSSAAWQNAIGACEDLQPPGFTGDEEVTAEEQETRLEFAQCMRDNGVEDFPDPTVDGPLTRRPRGVDTCSHLRQRPAHAKVTRTRRFPGASSPRVAGLRRR
jgi:hypothetical protein